MSQQVIGIIGTGRVGGAIAVALSRAGVRVGPLWSRACAHAHEVASRVVGAWAVPAAADVAAASDLTIIAVPDRAIAPVCESIPWRRGAMVVHTSGSMSRDALASAAAAGAQVGGWHPLKSFAGTPRDADLAGSTFAIEAESSVRGALLSLTDAVGGVPIFLEPGDRARYHAAAALASNGLVALLADAAEMWGEFGIDRAHALAALLPLVEGTVANLRAVGLPDALTGPVERGDVETVRAHMAAMDVRESAAYRALGRTAVRLADERGRLTDEQRRALDALLAEPVVGVVECGPPRP